MQTSLQTQLWKRWVSHLHTISANLPPWVGCHTLASSRNTIRYTTLWSSSSTTILQYSKIDSQEYSASLPWRTEVHRNYKPGIPTNAKRSMVTNLVQLDGYVCIFQGKATFLTQVQSLVTLMHFLFQGTRTSEKTRATTICSIGIGKISNNILVLKAKQLSTLDDIWRHCELPQ